MSLLSLGLGTSGTVLPREDGEVVGKVEVFPQTHLLPASQEQPCSFGYAGTSSQTLMSHWPASPTPHPPGSQLQPAGTDSPLPAPSLRLLLAHPCEMGTP